MSHSPSLASQASVDAWRRMPRSLRRVVFRCSLSVAQPVDAVFLCLNSLRRLDLRGLSSLSYGSSRLIGWPMRRSGSADFSCTLRVKSENDLFFGANAEFAAETSVSTLPSQCFFALLRREETQSVIETSSARAIPWAQGERAPAAALTTLPTQAVSDAQIDFSYKGTVLLQSVRLGPQSSNRSASPSSFSTQSTPRLSPVLPDSAPSPRGEPMAQPSVQPSAPVFAPYPVGDPSVGAYPVFNAVPPAMAMPVNVAPAAGALPYNAPFVILENGQLCWCVSQPIVCPGFSSVASDPWRVC